jgi:hypothetical protein
MAHKINNSGGSYFAGPRPSNKGTADMPFDASSRLNCPSIGEKLAKLSEFIAGDLESRTTCGLQATSYYLVIARSPRSPVAQALRMHATTLAAAGVTVRAIFSEIERICPEDMAAPFALPAECRAIRDTRLHAAHEQLVLSPVRTWIGDSMRREPSKRDTYERFTANSAETSATAVRSFEQLWRAAVPVQTMPSLPVALASQLPGLAASPLARPEYPRRQ